MRIVIARAEHEVAFQDIVDLWSKHAANLDAIDMLAIAANALGKMMALQDQRKRTPEQIMEIVAANLEKGNQQIVAKLSQTVGSVQ
jgi:hypothetical protein